MSAGHQTLQTHGGRQIHSINDHIWTAWSAGPKHPIRDHRESEEAEPRFNVLKKTLNCPTLPVLPTEEDVVWVSEQILNLSILFVG